VEGLNGARNARAVISRYSIPCDMHLNEEGHRFIADAFLREWQVVQ